MKKKKDKKLFYYQRTGGYEYKMFSAEVTNRKVMIYTLLINETNKTAKTTRILILLFEESKKNQNEDEYVSV